MQVVVNDTLINYQDSGKGMVLLCVHGWMHDSSSYKQLTEELRGTYRLISLDLPNFGASQMTDKIEAVSDYALFLKAFVQKLNIQDFVLIGHSMGCQIAIYAVGNEILKPKKLVLLSPAGVRNNGKGYKRTLKYASKLLRYVVPTKYKKKFYTLIGSDYNPDMLDIHKRIINKTLSTDIQDDARRIHIPTVLVNGTDDRETPMWMAKTLHDEIPRSTLDIIKNGDHWSHQKHAAAVAEIIRVFVS